MLYRLLLLQLCHGSKVLLLPYYITTVLQLPYGVTTTVPCKHGITTTVLYNHGITTTVPCKHGITTTVLRSHGVTTIVSVSSKLAVASMAYVIHVACMYYCSVYVTVATAIIKLLLALRDSTVYI